MTSVVHIVGPAALYPVLLGYKIKFGYVVLIMIIEGILLLGLLSPVLLSKLIQYWTKPQAGNS